MLEVFHIKDIRCKKCNKLLFKITKIFKGNIEVKCPKCKSTTLYNLEVPETQRGKVS